MYYLINKSLCNIEFYKMEVNMIINTTHYCWVIGNTGFRESALYEKIESYLMILNEFKERKYKWSVNQGDFFKLMQEYGFMEKGSTSQINAPKAARLKTSPLEKLGLINIDREITQVGKIILERAKQRIENNHFIVDEEHFLENDGDVYIRQLFKLHFYANIEEKFGIRPFVLFLKFLKEFKYLSKNEMRYILPLIICEELEEYGKESIRQYRAAKQSKAFDEHIWVREYIIKHKEKLSNVQKIKEYISLNIEEIEVGFKSLDKNIINQFLIEIDDNGKSKKYSLKLYELFIGLYMLWKNIDDEEKSKEAINQIIKGIDNTSSTQQKEWRKMILGVTNKASLRSINSAKYNDYKRWFINNIYYGDFEKFTFKIFDILWCIKIINNLNDYEDHNTRYLKLSNILETGYIEGEKALKISEFYVPLIEKMLVEDSLKTVIYNESEYKDYLYSNVTFRLPKLLETDMGVIANKVIEEIKAISEEDVQETKPTNLNYRQWITVLKNKLIEKKVINMIEDLRNNILEGNSDNLISCLKLISKRKDSKLREIIETEADIPTVFEYLVWQSFLVLGDYKHNPINFANFSFDNDLKPVQHAGGGTADVIFKYENHDLILEATLTNDENQRKLEMEPVPRHLAKYRFEENNDSYCIFIASNIDPNVAVVHRAFINLPYYVKNKFSGEYIAVEKSAIIPLAIGDLIKIVDYSVKKDILYKKLKENIFDLVIASKEVNGYKWYHNDIKTRLMSLIRLT